jgi:hypothetical protein
MEKLAEGQAMGLPVGDGLRVEGTEKSIFLNLKACFERLWVEG